LKLEQPTRSGPTPPLPYQSR